MLIQFNFKNYKSFHDRATLDLTATSEKNHFEDLITLNDNKILPYAVIYGANASGKSTVIDAFYTMAKSIVQSYDSNVKEPFEVVPFLFSDKSKKEPSEFEVFIVLNGIEYRYGFLANKSEILEEWLTEKPFKKGTQASEKIVFERIKNKFVFSNKLKKLSELSALVNEKSLMLSFLGRKNLDVLGEIYFWFLNIDYLSNPFQSYYSKQSLELLYKNPKLEKEFTKILKEIDPCLEHIEIKEKLNENQKKYYEGYGKHLNIDNNEYVLLPLAGESDGTQKSIVLLPIILTVLNKGGLLFIDELDIHLHPLLLKKIVDMFTNKKLNKKNAQLVFTSHNTQLMNSKFTRRDQVFFVEKNNETGKSILYSLSDFKKVRVDSDYEGNYFSGNFGSIPFN